MPDTLFSNKSELVTYSDTIFSHKAAAPSSPSIKKVQLSLISFLSVVQKNNVDFLPIMWQPSGILGKGGSGTISQSTISTDIGLAFKRFHESGQQNECFLQLITEVLILSQPKIQNHPNIITLEGVCWEIQKNTLKAFPVLVLEKAAWDLQQFMNVKEGMDMHISDRLNVCASIGSAIIALHSYG